MVEKKERVYCKGCEHKGFRGWPNLCEPYCQLPGAAEDDPVSGPQYKRPVCRDKNARFDCKDFKPKPEPDPIAGLNGLKCELKRLGARVDSIYDRQEAHATGHYNRRLRPRLRRLVAGGKR